MMKITAYDDDQAVILRPEGVLTGEWVSELLRCWQQAASGERRSIRVDLTGVTWVSEAGRELLALIYRHGAELVAADVLMKAIVDEIAKEGGHLTITEGGRTNE